MNIQIRKALTSDAPAVAHVHIQSWRTTYRGIIDDNYLDSLNLEKKAQTWARLLKNQERPTWGCVVGEQIVGFASAGANRTQNDYDGELYALYFLKTFQDKGLGRQLMTAAVQYLLESGFKAMQVWVLRDNPAVNFYKKCGGKWIGEQELKIGQQVLIESAYVWEDLASF